MLVKILLLIPLVLSMGCYAFLFWAEATGWEPKRKR